MVGVQRVELAFGFDFLLEIVLQDGFFDVVGGRVKHALDVEEQDGLQVREDAIVQFGLEEIVFAGKVKQIRRLMQVLLRHDLSHFFYAFQVLIIVQEVVNKGAHFELV